MAAVLQVGDAIEVAGKQDSSVTNDPILAELEQLLTPQVEELSTESTLNEPSTSNNAR